MSVEDDFAREKAESAIDWARRKIKSAGYHVTKVHRIFPPDALRETEVLFRGRKLDKAGPPLPLTAYIPDDPNGEVDIVDDW